MAGVVSDGRHTEPANDEFNILIHIQIFTRQSTSHVYHEICTSVSLSMYVDIVHYNCMCFCMY